MDEKNMFVSFVYASHYTNYNEVFGNAVLNVENPVNCEEHIVAITQAVLLEIQKVDDTANRITIISMQRLPL